MKALKKAEYNPDVVREPATSDRGSTPPISGTPAQAANAFVTPAPPPASFFMKALLLGLLVFGASGVWFLLRPTPQAPIYLRQPQASSSYQPAPPIIPQASVVTPVQPAPAIPGEAPLQQTVLPESAVHPTPPIIAEKTVAPPTLKIAAHPADTALPKASGAGGGVQVRSPQTAGKPVTRPRNPAATRSPATPLISPVEPDLLNAYQALQRGEYKAAEELYKNVRARQPSNIDALLGSAVIAGYQNQTDQALQFYTRVLELDAANSLAQAGLIGIIGKSDVSLAETRLKELIANKPAAHFYFALGNLYANQGQWEQAQAAYFEAHHLQPLHADYSYNLAVALDQMRLTGPALQYYLKAQTLSESKSNILFDRAKLNRRIAELKNIAP